MRRIKLSVGKLNNQVRQICMGCGNLHIYVPEDLCLMTYVSIENYQFRYCNKCWIRFKRKMRSLLEKN